MNETNRHPAVAVVMCTFNGEAYVKEQIDSILAQTYPITEFLIFDDRSTDRTAEIIEAYCQKHPFIQFQKNAENLGYNLNFEQALKAATCEVIAIADQDDVWHPQKLELMLLHWKPEAPLIHCDSQRFEQVIPTSNRHRHLYYRFEGSDTKKLFVFNSISGHAMLLRKSFLPFILPFQKDIYYDWWAGVVATCHGGVDYVDKVLVYQRVHRRNASISHTGTERTRFIQYRNEIITHIKKFLTAPGLDEDASRHGQQLYRHMTHIHSLGGRLRFFLFILQNRTWFFYTKKRKVALFSHIKHAARWAFY